jgi:adenylate cyclase
MKPRIKDILLLQIIAWVIAMNFIALIRLLAASDITHLYFFRGEFRLGLYLMVHTLGGMMIGIFLSIADIYIIRTIKAKHSFGYFLFRKSTIYILTIFIILALISSCSAIILNIPSEQILTFLFSRVMLTYLLFSILISVLIGFISQVNEKFGPGILLPMFLGKYHKPREEFVFIIFIDLTSSTTIAEKLGHQKYSCFVQDFMFDLNVASSQFDAEIYQYVGDEAVLTWNYEKGKYNENSLRIVEGFKRIIQSRAEYYQDKYGEIPRFKAGLNAGKLMVTEVGYIKKEIAYHGDVINTAARIMSKCNEFKSDFLVSGNIAEIFAESENFKLDNLGKIPLKGKLKEIEIFAVNQVA